MAQFVAWSAQLIQSWGYLGIFAVSFLGGASIFLPVPAYLVVVAAGAYLNPWLIALVAGAGAALGELTGYGIGFGGGKLAGKRHKRLLDRSRVWSERHGMFPLLVLFAATPLPDDVTGLIAGAIRYDIRKFLGATFIGKVIAHAALAWAGAFGSSMIGGWNMLALLAVSFIIMAVLYVLVFRTIRENSA